MGVGVLLLLLGGCWNGSQSRNAPQQESSQQAEAGRQEKNKPPVQLQRWLTLPAELTRLNSFYKEGHWGAGIIDAISRQRDLPQARLVSEPIQLFGSPYELELSRPVSLARGSPKRLEVPLFLTKLPAPNNVGAPGLLNAFRQTIPLTWYLEDRRTGTLLTTVAASTNRQRRHQFYVVVLASDPAPYNFLRHMHWVEPFPPPVVMRDVSTSVYRLVIPPPGRYVPLPSSSLAWTGIAYLFWDGIDPSNFTPAQQEALIDWLHWGGQLIVVAPGSMIRLQSSFLAPYLPADSDRLVELPPEELRVLDRWSLAQGNKRRLRLDKAWTVARLRPRSEKTVQVVLESSKQKLPLVVERRVGRGRVCVVAFSLVQPELHPRRWSQVDHFYNSCLLRLPSREFLSLLPNEPVPPDLVEPFQTAFPIDQLGLAREKIVVQRWSDGKPLFWARRFTPLRLFARDSLDDKSWNASAEGVESSAGADPLACPDFSTLLAVRWAHEPGTVLGTQLQDIPKGTLAYQAREALRRGAGITIPSRKFVLGFLAVYLTVLVPLNWLVFRLIGRVEWAWWAAIPITLIAAGTVVRLAQLNIGFARSRSEVVVVEVQPEAPRMHVTRFMALYASLGTSFQVHLRQPNAMVLPLPDPLAGEVSRLTGRFGLASTHRVRFTWDGNSCRLEDFFVPSNSLGMLRCEQVLPSPGRILCQEKPDRWTLRNRTPWSFQGGVLLAPEGGALLPGEFPSQQSVSVRRSELLSWDELTRRLPSTLSLQKLDVASVVRLACRWHAREPDAVRLVLWGSEAPEAMQLRPEVSQTRRAALFLFHLDYVPLPQPELDRTPVPPFRWNEDQPEGAASDAETDRELLPADGLAP